MYTYMATRNEGGRIIRAWTNYDNFILGGKKYQTKNYSTSVRRACVPVINVYSVHIYVFNTS